MAANGASRRHANRQFANIAVVEYKFGRRCSARIVGFANFYAIKTFVEVIELDRRGGKTEPWRRRLVGCRRIGAEIEAILPIGEWASVAIERMSQDASKWLEP